MSAQNVAMSLQIKFCTYEAAKYAVENWHYSKTMPSSKLTKFGVWEDGKFIGCIIFGRGANKNLASSYGLSQLECVELVRVALKEHKTPVSRLIAISLKLLKKHASGLKLVVSYADEKQKHLGVVYQASNWIYTGVSIGEAVIDPEDGVAKHRRTMSSKYGSVAGFKRVKDLPKHRYLYPLDEVVRSSILKYRMEYPKALVV